MKQKRNRFADTENTLAVTSWGGNIGVGGWEPQTIGYKLDPRMHCTT